MSFSEVQYLYPASASTSDEDPLSPSPPPSPNARRRLPTVPRRPRPTSRPLPPVPRPLWCRQCQTLITSINHLLPMTKIPEDARQFRGFAGQASLFTQIHHINLAKPAVQLMATGAHTMSEITCSGCSSYLGWHIIKAHEPTERWKEGHYLLEFEHLLATTDSSRPPRRFSSDSDESI